MLGPDSRRGGGRRRAARPFGVALLLAVVLAAAACTSAGTQTIVPPPPTAAVSTAPAKSTDPPQTPAGAQLRWLMAELARLPMSDAQVRAHFDAAFLAQVSPAALNQSLEAAIRLDLLSIQVSEPSTLVVNVLAGGGERAQVWLDVDSHGLVSWLRISPADIGPTPATWAGVDTALRAVAPRIRLLVARVSGGSCVPVHSIDPGTAAPLGSAFKLYVLDALGDAVAAGKVRWDQPLTVTAQLKGLPPGELQTEPAPLPTLAQAGTWTKPREIDKLAYFGSATDLCRAYASLAALDRQPGLSPIGQALSVNDDGLQLDPAQWKTTWFKGGSEPGALSLAYLATTRAGQSYVVTVLAEDPSQPLADNAIPAIVAAVKGAFTLAARG